jgi:trk system potassium uptake protein
MNIVIVGCGRVGSKLAAHYSSEGHRVSVIDEQEEAAANLDPGSPVSFHYGAALDLEVLKEAGLEEADVCIVATDGDNTNLVVAQLAREEFGVECVVARVFDPHRARFYEGRGINVVCPVELTVAGVFQAVHAFEEGVDL